MNYTIKKLEIPEHSTWDQFVNNSPQGTIFHTSYWLAASGEDFVIYGVFQGQRLVAGLPLIRQELKFGIKSAGHPALTPYLGVLFGPKDGKYVHRISSEKEISRAIAKRIKEDFGVINFNFPPGHVDLQPFIWEGFSSSVRYTYILRLDDLKQVWVDMDETRRRNIRRAEKDGIYVEDDADFGELFALVEKTFERQGMEARFRATAFRYNEVLEKKGQCQSFLARNKDGIPLAGVYIVWDWNRSYYLLGGYDPKRSHHGASALAMWAAIRFTKEELELNEFDFEGSMIPAVEQFFRKFGGRLTPYYSVSWVRPVLKAGFYVKHGLSKILKWW